MPSKFNVDFWTCTCGKPSTQGVLTCKCGLSKPEITLHKNKIEVTREPKPRKQKPMTNTRKAGIHEARKENKDSIATSCMGRGL